MTNDEIRMNDQIRAGGPRDSLLGRTPEDIGMLSEDETESCEGTFQERVEAFKRRLIEQALKEANGNQAQAARLLELSYHQFRYYLGKSGRRTAAV